MFVYNSSLNFAEAWMYQIIICFVSPWLKSILFSEDLDFIDNLLYQSFLSLFVTLTLLLQVGFMYFSLIRVIIPIAFTTLPNLSTEEVITLIFSTEISLGFYVSEITVYCNNTQLKMLPL